MNNPTVKQIGLVVKTRRVKAKLRQVEIAELAGLDSSVISKLETGFSSPNYGTLCAVAAGLGLSVIELLELACIQGSPIGVTAKRVYSKKKKSKWARFLELFTK